MGIRSHVRPHGNFGANTVDSIKQRPQKSHSNAEYIKLQPRNDTHNKTAANQRHDDGNDLFDRHFFFEKHDGNNCHKYGRDHQKHGHRRCRCIAQRPIAG